MPSVFKRAFFKISSVIENNEGGAVSDTERSFSEAEGSLRISDGEINLSYKESGEGGDVHTSICKRDGSVTVRRTGAINSLMVFTEGERHSSVYSLGGYKFDMSLYTKRIRCDIGESGGTLRLLYDMNIGGASKNCIMKIDVTSGGGSEK